MLSKFYSCINRQTSRRCAVVGRGRVAVGVGRGRLLTAFELQHGHTDGQERHYPHGGGHEAHVHVELQQVPATGEYAPQRGRGHGQRQAVADVPQQHRHALHRPDDTCKRESTTEMRTTRKRKNFRIREQLLLKKRHSRRHNFVFFFGNRF